MDEDWRENFQNFVSWKKSADMDIDGFPLMSETVLIPFDDERAYDEDGAILVTAYAQSYRDVQQPLHGASVRSGYVDPSSRAREAYPTLTIRTFGGKDHRSTAKTAVDSHSMQQVWQGRVHATTLSTDIWRDSHDTDCNPRPRKKLHSSNPTDEVVLICPVGCRAGPPTPGRCEAHLQPEVHEAESLSAVATRCDCG